MFVKHISAGAVLFGPALAFADGAIDSLGIWNGIAHSLVDFETRPDGDPIDLANGTGIDVSPGVWRDSGLVFGGSIPPFILNDQDETYEAVLDLIGSPENTIGLLQEAEDIPPAFVFEPDVFAFSFSVIINERFFNDTWSMEVFDGDFDSIGVFHVEDFAFQTLGDFRYGVVGYWSNAPIAGATVQGNFGEWVTYDDVRFTTEMVPAPMTATPLLLGALALARRRR